MRLVGGDGEKRTTINAIRSNPLDAILNAIDRPTFRPEISLDVVSFHYCFSLSTTGLQCFIKHLLARHKATLKAIKRSTLLSISTL